MRLNAYFKRADGILQKFSYMICYGSDIFRISRTTVWNGEATLNTNGLFHYDSSLGINSITDGTSNTLAMSETAISNGNRPSTSMTLSEIYNARLEKMLTITLGMTRTPIAGSAPDYNIVSNPDNVVTGLGASAYGVASYRGCSWVVGAPYSSVFGTFIEPNSRKIPSVNWMNHGFYSATSYHTSGVNALLADGSVHFVSDGIDYETWRGAGTINKGEVNTGF
jgi:prepilin-type processing-associated H-X9-DG protein